MPIKINELIIKARVTEENLSPGKGMGPISPVDTQLIIKECVDQVLEIINDKKER